MMVSEAKKLGYTFQHARTIRGDKLVWGVQLISPLGTREQYRECPASSTEGEREQQIVEWYNSKMANYTRMLERK